MSKYIDYEYAMRILRDSKTSVQAGINAQETLELLSWQSTVYGERTMSDIMDAYNDSKLQYCM